MSARGPEAPPLALTMGEPAGIGGEITLRAWCARDKFTLPGFFAIDDPARLEAVAAAMGLAVPIAVIDAPEQAGARFSGALPVLPLSLAIPTVPGRPDPRNAPATCRAIELAVELTRAGRTTAMVTNPIQKATLYEAGFRHQGHTDYLAALLGAKSEPVMMLAAPGLKVVPVTIHLSLGQAVESLTTAAILHAARVSEAALRDDFAIARPRLAIAGLNPHAGEAGALGREEIEIIAPAIEALRREGMDVVGPMVPDAMFHAGARAGYDAAICMYHDQALIPLKTLDFENGVNLTLGLSIVRTSPDHGTALDIAGRGRASAASLIQAIRVAGEIGARRRAAAAR